MSMSTTAVAAKICDTETPARSGAKARWLLMASALAVLAAVATNAGEFSRPGLALVAVAAILAASGIHAARGTAESSVQARASRGRERFLWWAVALHLGIAIVVLRTEPGEVIDVFQFQTGAAQAFLHGTNPYTITHRNIYRDTRFYGDGMVVNGRVQVGLPYPPLSLFFVLPGYLLGDIRYSYLFAMMVSAVLLARLRPDWFGAGCAVFLLLNPITFFVLARSWTEPLVLLTVCLTLYAALRHPKWLGLALGLMLASKQYSLLAVPLAAMLLERFSWKSYGKLLAQAAGVALVVTAPLALANPRSFFHDVVVFLIRQPVRKDALSFTTIAPIPFVAAFGLVAVAMAWCVARAPRRPGMFAACFGFVLLVVCLNKQAFANYYFLVVSVSCAAAVTLELGGRQPQGPSTRAANCTPERATPARSGDPAQSAALARDGTP